MNPIYDVASGGRGIPLLRSVGKAAKWLGSKTLDHPKITLGGAAAVGLLRAHPMRSLAGIGATTGVPTFMTPFATKSTIANMLLGDPDAGGKLIHAAYTKAAADIVSPYNNAAIPVKGVSNPYGGPNGSLVFGLYNDRLK